MKNTVYEYVIKTDENCLYKLFCEKKFNSQHKIIISNFLVFITHRKMTC